METKARVEVARNIFVAIEAQCILIGPAEWFMAGRAFSLEVRMSLCNFAGHHKRLNRLSGSGIAADAE